MRYCKRVLSSCLDDPAANGVQAFTLSVTVERPFCPQDLVSANWHLDEVNLASLAEMDFSLSRPIVGN